MRLAMSMHSDTRSSHGISLSSDPNRVHLMNINCCRRIRLPESLLLIQVWVSEEVGDGPKSC